MKSETSTPRLGANQFNTMPEQNIERPLIDQSLIQYNDRWTQDLDSTPSIQMISPEEDQLNDSIVTLLNTTRLAKTIFRNDKNMTRCHEYDNLMRDITIYDGENLESANWLYCITPKNIN